MAATGSGTQTDPYIVDNWDDFLSVCNISSTTYIVWDDAEDKVVDFNEINPNGFTDTIYLKGFIDFNNWELRNFYSTAQIAIQLGNSYSDTPQSVSNLRIVNAKHDATSTNEHDFIRVWTKDGSTLDDVVVSLEFSATSYKFLNTMGYKVVLHRFGAYVYGIANESFRYIGAVNNYGNCTAYHCRLHMDVQDARNASDDFTHMFSKTTFYNTVISGTYLRDGTGDGKLLIGTTASALNIIRLQSNKGVKYNGSGISLKIDRDYTGDIVRPNIVTWDEHVLLVNENQSRTQQEEILAAGFPLHKAVD